MYPHVIDATRIIDGKLVTIKCLPTDGLEIRIALMLGTPPLSEDPSNHSVPILDTFEDETNAEVSYIVMPLLRNFDNPPFESVEDVLEFGEQVLEVSISMLINNSPPLDVQLLMNVRRAFLSCIGKGLHIGVSRLEWAPRPRLLDTETVHPPIS